MNLWNSRFDNRFDYAFEWFPPDIAMLKDPFQKPSQYKILPIHSQHPFSTKYKKTCLKTYQNATSRFHGFHRSFHCGLMDSFHSIILKLAKHNFWTSFEQCRKANWAAPWRASLPSKQNCGNSSIYRVIHHSTSQKPIFFQEGMWIPPPGQMELLQGGAGGESVTPNNSFTFYRGNENRKF